ncbi:hypothetical protein [Natrialbaceae archaeon AArc-T1-2]|uniref:hypothetical protein n=1 Tax=Natrialbaceae archaeon AArc-T1-2 TaxID=3053904 RepID=UPI00255B35D9|nr:hypothetical protein [Natrialbaceae archaeon AArc-T1-2]WIV68247.1 hypothetical protein QQ977_05845 [Natrialbaceae archaeon AArc-T1-2]
MTEETPPSDRKRFTTDEFRDIDEIADPHTTEDDTKEPISAKIKRNWKFLAVVVPIGLAAVGILIGYDNDR